MDDRIWGRAALSLALISILIVAGMAYLYLSSVKEVKKEQFIGVIDVEGPIISSETAGEISAAINEATHETDIKAVVLRINSPGGVSHLIEQVYLDILVLKNVKPVVVSTLMALSGGYYLAVAAQEIYSTGTAMVGNIGVVGVAPGFLIPSESEYETGPQKVTGFSHTFFPYNLSHALDAFVGAVYEGRGDKLNITSHELKTGKIWLGSEALSKGLVDGIGGLQVAASRAAKLANIDVYSIRKISSKELKETENDGGIQNLGNLSLSQVSQSYPPPAIHYIYFPSEAFTNKAENNITVPNENITEPKGVFRQVVVDLSHENKVSPWVFDMLQAKLSSRGIPVGYSDDWGDIEGALHRASCLIVAAPTKHYNYTEYKSILEFVNKGRLLLLFYDPSVEFNDIPALNGPVNSLAKHWGFHFGKGYLYNQYENYGIYRNIYVRDFENKTLSKGLESLVFFTSTYIHPTDSDAGYSTARTFNSVSEKSQKYAVYSILEKGNGTIACFGDLTWMMEPYVYLEDNMDLLMNLVNSIRGIEVPSEEES